MCEVCQRLSTGEGRAPRDLVDHGVRLVGESEHGSPIFEDDSGQRWRLYTDPIYEDDWFLPLRQTAPPGDDNPDRAADTPPARPR